LLDGRLELIRNSRYISFEDNSEYALNADTGALLWRFQTGGYIVVPAVIVNGVVHFPSYDTYEYAVVASAPTQYPSQAPTGSERLGGGNPSGASVTRCVCDPIDTYSGKFSHTVSDVRIPGRGLALAFSHTYNAGAAAQTGPLGYGWTDSYNWSLRVDGAGNLTITHENGSTVTFAPYGLGGYTPPSRVLATLVKNGDGTYTLTRAQSQNRYSFNASGQLAAETDRNGYVTSLAYNGSGQLTTVTDPAG
jgi:YD repeat-containing protein